MPIGSSVGDEMQTARGAKGGGEQGGGGLKRDHLTQNRKVTQLDSKKWHLSPQTPAPAVWRHRNCADVHDKLQKQSHASVLKKDAVHSLTGSSQLLQVFHVDTTESSKVDAGPKRITTAATIAPCSNAATERKPGFSSQAES
jgi:hypothetical protein